MAELFKVNAPVRKPLFEGVQGENEARSIQFDIEPWVTELGDGAVTATAKRSQDSQPYPVTVTKDGNTVTWKPTSTDTAFAGVGSFQLEYTVDSVLAKTCIWSTMVAPSLDPAGDPPDPYDNWLAEMRQIAADALQDAQDADASADAAAASAASIAGDHDELVNIRIGADGTTYSSAGDAVRGQVSDLNNAVKEAYDGYTPIVINIKHDGYYSRYNAFTSDEGRSYAIVPVNANEAFKITSYIRSGVIPAIIYRDSNNNLLGYDKLGTGVDEVITDYEFVTPANCTTLIVQSASYDYELSLKKYTNELINKDITLKNIITVKLGSELLTNDASAMPTGWSGSNADGYTHTSGNTGDLKFSLGGIVDIGCDYIFEFDTDYTADEFVNVGLGNSYRILAYNGTGHIVLPLRAIDSFNLFITPYKNVSFTISNLSLKKIQSEGTEKDIDFGAVLVDSNDSNYGFWNVILGEHALENAVGSTRCIAIGNGAFGDLQGGHRNIGIGTFAGSQMESGEMNLIFGADGMFTVKKALSCIAIGKGAMHNGTYLKHNIAIGNGALNGSSDSISEFNIALGANAGYACKGERNIFMGYNTAMEVASGIANVYIGDQCTGANGKNQNVVIGASAKATGTANRSIALGYQAQTSKENQMVLGGTNITEVVLCGNKKIIFNNDGTVTWESV